MDLSIIVMAAGKGSRMTDLTVHCPKALLPIGNLPMIWYPLHFLEMSGADEAFVVVQDNFKSKFEEQLRKTDIKMNLTFVPMASSNEDAGTADSLRHVHQLHKLKRNVMVISCDLITDIRLHKLLDVHRMYDCALTALFAPIPGEFIGLPIPGSKSKQKLERDFVGFDPNLCQILFMSSEADFDETLTLKKSLLQQFPQILFRSKLLDAHLYIFKRWVLDFLVAEKSISAIKGELVPLLVKRQFSRMPMDAQNGVAIASTTMVPTKKDIHQFAQEDSDVTLVKALTSWSMHNGHNSFNRRQNPLISCFGYVAEGQFCLRANNLANYSEINRQIAKQWAILVSDAERPLVHPSVNVASKQVGNDCVVGENTTIGEKSSIKRSAIGCGCQIGEKVKIANCVILDNVKILEGCNLQGCVVGSNATISEQNELKDCLVGANQTANVGKLSNEVISNVGHLMSFN